MKVRILTDNHFHRDEPVKPGAIIEVDESDGAWLIRDGIAEPVDETKKRGE